MIYKLNSPILNKLIYNLRDPNTKKEKFRICLEKISEYIGTEIAKNLPQKKISIKTIFDELVFHYLIAEDPVLLAILRAGNPLLHGLQKIFPNSEIGFFGIKRNEKTLSAKIYYKAIPKVRKKTVIIADVMIATGNTIINSIKCIEKQNPSSIILVGVFFSKEGIDNILKYNDKIKIYAAAIDPIVNEKGYIIPGCGDAGDRLYGEKQK